MSIEQHVPTSAHQHCGSCPVKDRQCVVPRDIDRTYEVAIVEDFPTDLEARTGEWLRSRRGGAGDLLKAVLEGVGFDLDDIYVCSALNCRPGAKKEAEKKKAMVACRKRLVRELREAGVKKVLCTGPIGWAALTSLPKLVGATTVRGRWKKAYGMSVLGTVPPGFCLNEPEYFRDLARDLRKFYETDGPEPWPEVNIWVPETIAEAQEAFEFLRERGTVSLDLETYGLSAISDDVLCAGFCALDENKLDATCVVIDETLLSRKMVWKEIGRLLSDPDLELVLHNGKFDLKFLKTQLERRGLTYRPDNIHDTMMLSYALDERPMGKYKAHGLENLARVRYDAPDYGIPMGKFLKEWETATAYDREQMRKRLHIYLGLDTYYTARLFPDLWNEVLEEDEKLMDLYDDLLIPGTLALAEVEHHGLLIDRPMLEASLADLRKKATKLHGRIQRVTGVADFNPNSPQQVKEYVYETLGMKAEVAMEALKAQAEDSKRISSRGAKEGARSRGTYTDPKRLKESATAAPVLRMLARGYPEHEEVIEDICEYRNITKNAGAYIEGWLQRLDEDGRLHPTFNLHGTATGRLSSSDPNLQNVPPSSHTGIPIRSAVMAPPNKVIIGADYKQLEVRVAAQLSGDPAMLELFKSGHDVHAEISQAIYDRPAEEISQYMRMLGKIVLFGLLYGRSPNSVATGPEQEDIVQRGGRRQTPDEVHEFFDNLLSDWAVYAEWRDELRRGAYEDGEVQLPAGRKRRFDFIPKHDGGHTGRQGLNTPVQGTASDVTLDALIRLQRELPEGASVILTVHDALYVECWKSDAKAVEELVRVTMEESEFFRCLTGVRKSDEETVPLKSDIKVGKRWDEEDDQLGSGVVKKPARKAPGAKASQRSKARTGTRRGRTQAPAKSSRRRAA